MAAVTLARDLGDYLLMVDHVRPAPAAAVQALTAADRALLLYQYDQEPSAHHRAAHAHVA